MRRKSKSDLVSSQQSVWFYSDMVENDPNLNKKSNYHYISETSMLIDDVQMTTLPIPRSSRKGYQIKLSASDPKVEDLIIGAIETQYDRSDLNEAIYDFFQQCVGVVMAYGDASYEIVYFSTGEGMIDSFRLALIPPSAFIISKNKFQQYVPLQIASELHLEKQYIEFTAENIVLFQLPEYVKAQHAQIMESLAFLGENLFPKFALENMYKPTIPFSQGDYFLSREIALAKATQIIGWNARNYSNEHKFEHYVWRRQLIFYKFLCSLRETILRILNEALTRIGNKMGFTAELSIEGLPNADDVDVALEKLQKGDLKTFDEVLKPFS
jgi:hypothetical protein